MATCRAVEDRASKRFGVTRAGGVLPAEEAAEAHSVLSGLYLDAITRSAKPALTRVRLPTTAAYNANEDEFITFGAGAATVNLPTSVADFCTGALRAPKDCSVIMVAGTTLKAWLYDEAYGAWVDCAALAQPSYAPFSNTDMESLSAALAGYLVDEYDRPISPALASFAQRGRDWLYGRLHKPKRVRVENALLRGKRHGFGW